MNAHIAISMQEYVSTKTGKPLFSEELYRRLQEVQEDIALYTDTMPTIKKLIEEIITDEAILKAKEDLIFLYS